MSLTVRLGELTFSGDDPFGRGFRVGADGFSGWNDGTQMRRRVNDRPQAHGVFDAPGFGEARVVRIEGWCNAGSIAELGHREAQFHSVISTNTLTIVVEEFDRILWAPKVRVDESSFVPFGGQSFGDYALKLWIANPRKYGEARTTAAAASAVSAHYGNSSASPVYTITGVAPGYTLAGPDGKAYTVTAALTGGVPHTIDMATGLLRVGGVIVFGAVTAASTWDVPGGVAITATVTPLSGSAAVAATVRDTFL